MASKVFIRNDGETPIVVKASAYKIGQNGIPQVADRFRTLAPKESGEFVIYAQEEKGISLAIEEERKIIISGEAPVFIEEVDKAVGRGNG